MLINFNGVAHQAAWAAYYQQLYAAQAAQAQAQAGQQATGKIFKCLVF